MVTNAQLDRTVKKRLYERTFRTHEYFCYDPANHKLEGWRLYVQIEACAMLKNRQALPKQVVRQIFEQVMIFLRFENGKIVEIGEDFDEFGMRQQLSAAE